MPFAVSDEELGHLIGEIVLGFQDDDFEHQSDIELRVSAFRLCFSQDGEKWAKCLSIDIAGKTFEKTVELAEFSVFVSAEIKFGRIASDQNKRENTAVLSTQWNDIKSLEVSL